MPRLESLISKETQSVVITFEGGEELNLEMQPSKFTLGWQQRVQKAGAANDVGQMADVFFEVIVGWDLLDDDDNVLPLSEASIELLPISLFTEIAVKMGEALNPKGKTSSKS